MTNIYMHIVQKRYRERQAEKTHWQNRVPQQHDATVSQDMQIIKVRKELSRCTFAAPFGIHLIKNQSI